MLSGDKLGEQAPGVGEIVLTKQGRAPWAGSGLRGIGDAVGLELGHERSGTGAQGKGRAFRKGTQHPVGPCSLPGSVRSRGEQNLPALRELLLFLGKLGCHMVSVWRSKER